MLPARLEPGELLVYPAGFSIKPQVPVAQVLGRLANELNIVFAVRALTPTPLGTKLLYL